MLSKKYLDDTGYFNSKAVSILIKKCKNSSVLGFRDNMAIVGIISTLLVHRMFIDEFEGKSHEITKNTLEGPIYGINN